METSEGGELQNLLWEEKERLSKIGSGEGFYARLSQRFWDDLKLVK